MYSSVYALLHDFVRLTMCARIYIRGQVKIVSSSHLNLICKRAELCIYVCTRKQLTSRSIVGYSIIGCFTCIFCSTYTYLIGSHFRKMHFSQKRIFSLSSFSDLQEAVDGQFQRTSGKFCVFESYR